MIRVNSMPFSDGAKRELKIKTDYRSFAVLIRSHGNIKNFRHIKYGPENFHCNRLNNESLNISGFPYPLLEPARIH
jgi:hypothetical protein